MTPPLARAPRGERAAGSAPASWATITVIAGWGLNGVRAPLALPRATGTATFQQYVERSLAPELHKGDVVIFNNLKPHQSAVVANAIKQTGAKVLPLPPSSPGYTPIEDDVLVGQTGAPSSRNKNENRTHTMPWGSSSGRSHIRISLDSFGIPGRAQRQSKPLSAFRGESSRAISRAGLAPAEPTRAARARP
ncbi:transposase [Singulisphaera acidiphila]|uniref:transposase n=1 Tax=Singulisphaera acidiphila TaxID=466153 RepID=UPI0012B52DCF